MLRKLIDESGVAHMALYRYFAGKEDLIKKVSRQCQSFIVGSIAEKLGPMPDVTTRFKGIFDRYDTWFHMSEFAGCLFEHALTEFSDTWLEVTDVTVYYRDDLLVIMETLFKDVMPASTAHRLVGVYVTRLTGVMTDARTTDDPSVVSQAWHAAETLLHQTRATAEAV